MRFRRIVISTLALCPMVSAVGLAQGAGTKVHFGVLAGATFAKLGGKDTEGENIKNRTGFAGGGFVGLGVSKNFEIEPEVLFVQKGAKASETGFTENLKVSYVEVPVLLKLRFPGKSGGTVVPHIYAGPYLGFKAGCHLSGTEGSTSFSGNCADEDFNIKSTDFGATFGGGVDVGRAIIDVRYDLGFSKISDDVSSNDIKTRTLYLLVGWTFRPAH
ncbi:MAG TPA: porin family protein [Gemmatimonadales bacterium]|nr:porin family protein [Gemmatimonadales bacterium]